jgi:hypothetical protein
MKGMIEEAIISEVTNSYPEEKRTMKETNKEIAQIVLLLLLDSVDQRSAKIGGKYHDHSSQ